MGKKRERSNPSHPLEPQSAPPVSETGAQPDDRQFNQSPRKFMLLVWGIPILVLTLVLLKRSCS